MKNVNTYVYQLHPGSLETDGGGAVGRNVSGPNLEESIDCVEAVPDGRSGVVPARDAADRVLTVLVHDYLVRIHKPRLVVKMEGHADATLVVEQFVRVLREAPGLVGVGSNPALPELEPAAPRQPQTEPLDRAAPPNL